MEAGEQLEAYLSRGVETIVKDILKASHKHPKASLFMAKYMVSSQKAREKRRRSERRGEHIPPFLIASITEQCNLHCKGCYARANHSCTEACEELGREGLLTEADWDSVFTQAEALGIEFILLAGGEPFLQREVLRRAGHHPGLLFPIFTNGTMLGDGYMELLEKNRNLMPVISIEGNENTTDARRGKGVYQKLRENMERLHKREILFGASVTVTKENMREVLADDFAQSLQAFGAKVILYVEYVPVDQSTEALAPDEQTRNEMMHRLDRLRASRSELVFLAFPGDERRSGGCLAAGRGFFHINARGGAEPCPFSPYSDTNIKRTSLKETLRSPLFCSLQTNGTLLQEHTGGCVLFEQREKVEAMLGAESV